MALFRPKHSDRAEPGALIDKFRIRISGPNGFNYDSYAACNCDGTLAKGGNIQIHNHKPGARLMTATGAESNPSESVSSLISSSDTSEIEALFARTWPIASW